MKKTLVLAIALLTLVLMLGFGGRAQPTAVTAEPFSVVKLFMPLIVKDFDSTPPGPTPIQITQELLAPTGGTPGLGDTILVHVGITNTGSKTITQLPVEMFFDARFLELMFVQPNPTATLPGNLVWDDVTVDYPMGVGRALGPGETFNLELTFQIIGCPPAEATPIRVKVVGAVDEDGETVGRASNITNLGVTCPEVTLSKRVVEPLTGIARVGDQVTFMIVVQNTGNQAIPNLPLTDTFDPNHLSYVSATPAPDSTSPVGTLTWNNLAADRPLLPGERITVMVTMLAVGCPAQHAAENTAMVGGAVALHNGTTYAVPEATATASVEIPCPDLRVEKRVVTPADGVVQPGDPVSFEIILENIGNKPMAVLPLDDIFDSQVLEFVSADPEPVVVIENLAQWDDLTGPAPNGFDGDLAPGESFTVTVNFRDIGCPYNQTARNEAKVSGAIAIYQGEEWSVPQVSDTAELTVEAGDIPCPAISVTKRLVEPSSGVAQPGDIATFEVAITNEGTQPIVSLPLEDDFEPEYLEFVSATPEPQSASLDPLMWLDLTSDDGFGHDLMPGETFTVSVQFRVVYCPLDEMTVNEARVAGAIAQKNGIDYPAPPALGSASLNIMCPEGYRDLSVTKTLISAASGVVQNGELLTYRITLRATGQKTITLLPLEDIFDLRYLEFVEASVTPDVAIPGLLQWDDLTGGAPFGFGRDLEPGEAFELTVTFQAIGCPPNQVTANTARVRGAAAVHNDIEYHYSWSITRSAIVRIACPAVRVSKYLVPLDCGIAGIGDPVQFNVVVENVGNTTLDQVTLVDTYEAPYLAFDSATPVPSDHSVVGDVGTLTWADLTVPAPEGFDRDLRPGEAFDVAVNFTALASTQWRWPPVTHNFADVFGVDEHGYSTVSMPGAHAEVSVGVADADLFIEKTGPGETHPGDTITYQVHYGNDGPDSATYVRILEAIPAGTVFVGDTLCGHVNTGCFLGTLPAGFGDSFEVQVYVPFGVAPGTVLENSISIASGQTPGGPVCGIQDHDEDNNVAGSGSTVLADFGQVDDPDTYSEDFTHEWLGELVLGETAAPDVEDENDGWLNKHPWYRTSRLVELDILVSTAGEGAARYGLPDERRLYLRGWLDFNQDGVFTDDELVLAWSGGPGTVGRWDYQPSQPLDGQWPLSEPTYRVKAQFTAPRLDDYTWVRFRLGYGQPPAASGVELFGEIEDHWVGFFNRDPQ